MNVKIAYTLPGAKMPTYATDGSACFDFYARTKARIAQHQFHSFDTGVVVEVPKGHVMLIFSRSGHGFNNHTRLANCVGVIDSDYRGSIAVKLVNDGGLPLDILPGHRIAQGMIIPAPRVAFEVVSQLEGTERGSGGFGSTGN